MRKQIKRYIAERRREGFSDELIRQKFIESGYDSSVVEACLREPKEKAAAKPEPLPGWIGWFILALFLATLVLLCQQLGWI